MMRRLGVRIVWAWTGLLVLGCAPADGPPTLRFGEEACARCRMIISDQRFASALTTEDGGSAKFDDVGCMVEHESSGFRPSASYWVRDFRADGWLDARAAIFRRSRSIASPMGFGVAAFGTSSAASGLDDAPDARTARFDGLPDLIASEPDGGSSDATPGTGPHP